MALPKSNSQVGLQEKDALKQFLQFIGDDILVAHYATFDQGMIHAVLERQVLGGAPPTFG